MPIRRICTLFIVFNFSALLALAQESGTGMISGRVLDAVSLKAVPDANIIIEDINKGSVSDGKGNFSLTNLKAGNYVISISHISYVKQKKEVQVKAGQKTNINFFLKNSVFSSATVEIVASNKQEKLSQSQRVTSIRAKEISLAPVLNINQMIDYTAGVMSNNTTGIFSSRVVVTMRGMPANDQGRTLVVMDGIPLNKSDGGSVNWNMLNKNNVEEINVIKGPGPAKYGSGAMGGVIEIITKNPGEKLDGNFNLEYGSFNTFGTELKLSGSEKIKNKPHNFFWDISGKGRMSDGYITTPEEFRTIEDTIMVPSFLKEYSVALKTGYDWGNQHVIKLQSLYFDDMRGNGVEVFDEFGAYSKHRTLSNILKYNGIKGFFKWQLNLFHNFENYFRVYEYMNQGEYKLYEADAIRGDMGIQADVDYYRFRDHKISFGINARAGSVNGSDTYYTSSDIINNEGKINILACYLQDEITFFDKRLLLNLGLRYDYARFYDAAFSIDFPSYSIAFYKDYEILDLETKKWDVMSPRLSLRYIISKNSRVFISYARGFRAPKLDDMTRTGNRKGTFAVANPDLKPEIVDAFEIGGDIFFYDNIVLSASIFHSTGKDFMYYTSTGDTVNMFYRKAPIINMSNIGKVRICGLEVEFRYKLEESFSAFCNYTLTDARIIRHNFQDARIDSNLAGKYLTDIPRHKVSGGVSWENRIINTSLLFKYYGETWINEWNTTETEYLFTDKFKGYLIFNINFEKRFMKRFSASLQIENIFDKKYINDNYQQCPGRMVFARLGVVL